MDKKKKVTSPKKAVKAKKQAVKPVKAKAVKKITAVVKKSAVKKAKAPVIRKKQVKPVGKEEEVHQAVIAEQATLSRETLKPAVKEAPHPQPKRETAPKPAVKETPQPQVKKETTPKPPPAPVIPPEPKLKELELDLPISVKDLSVRLQEKPSLVIKTLMGMRVMVGINQSLDEETVSAVCRKFGYRVKRALSKEEAILGAHKEEDTPQQLKPRHPIVTLMGHVDHGKTSLLDAIRKSKVVDKEHGGITQHIGAYRVVLPQGVITFLDTPGHEAFTAMRARGAGTTDIVVLVVAADDGIMPQTREAIDHARAAGVPIVVAVNKIDKPQADLDRVKKQLSQIDLLSEDWGGKTITVPVSAKTGEGIDNLLEMLLLEAQMLELKANPLRAASGVVIEAKLSKGRGPVSTLLVKNGTLKLNHSLIVGKQYGKVRAMFDDRGRSVIEAGPSTPVEVLGISGIPLAGEQFFVVEDEKTARELASKRQEAERVAQMKSAKKISLEELHAQIIEGKIKDLKMIIKADVQGSLEAIRDTLNRLNVSEIKLEIIHEGVGSINSSDVILAVASNALVLGFNVTAEDLAKDMASKEGVDVRTYNIIYELANDIKAAIEGMLEPKLKKVFLGRVEIRKVFKLSRSGTVAGCFVVKGKINRSANVSVVRNGQEIFGGKLSSLKRFKDDVRDVQEGFECGLTVSGFDAIQEGDIVEAYEIEKIARKL